MRHLRFTVVGARLAASRSAETRALPLGLSWSACSADSGDGVFGPGHTCCISSAIRNQRICPLGESGLLHHLRHTSEPMNHVIDARMSSVIVAPTRGSSCRSLSDTRIKLRLAMQHLSVPAAQTVKNRIATIADDATPTRKPTTALSMKTHIENMTGVDRLTRSGAGNSAFSCGIIRSSPDLSRVTGTQKAEFTPAVVEPDRGSNGKTPGGEMVPVGSLRFTNRVALSLFSSRCARASAGPISSLSWKAKTVSGQPGRDRTRWEP